MTASVLDGAAMAREFLPGCSRASLRSRSAASAGSGDGARRRQSRFARLHAQQGASVRGDGTARGDARAARDVRGNRGARESRGAQREPGDPRHHRPASAAAAASNAQRVLQSIAIEKDVDGFNWCNLGALVDGRMRLAPCTPLGVMKMLERAGIAIEGRHAVVIGRSSIVGKPMALMLIARGATVTVCNSKTPDLGMPHAGSGHPRRRRGPRAARHRRHGEAGRVVIDVGINAAPKASSWATSITSAVREIAARSAPCPAASAA